MSEGVSTDGSPSPEEVPDLATTYLEASDEEPEHQERLNVLEEELDEMESTREEVVKDVGEDHYLVEDIESDIEKLEEERQDLIASTEDVAELRDDLLRAAAENPGFRLNEYWLNPEMIQAMTDILYGTQDKKLVISDYELSTPDDAQDLDRMDKITVKREVVHLARDMLQGDDRVATRWEEFKDSRAHQAFPIIAQDPGVGRSDIAKAYDKSSSTVRNWTSDLSDQEELKMVYTPQQGQYHLSTVGKYYAKHYADLDDGVDGAKNNEESEEESKDGESSVDSKRDENDELDSQQVDLGNSSKGSDDKTGEASGDDPGVTLDGAETTEEKAEALFDEVSETRDN